MSDALSRASLSRVTVTNSCTRERRPRAREFNGRVKRPRATEKNETVREKETLTSAVVLWPEGGRTLWRC